MNKTPFYVFVAIVNWEMVITKYIMKRCDLTDECGMVKGNIKHIFKFEDCGFTIESADRPDMSLEFYKDFIINTIKIVIDTRIPDGWIEHIKNKLANLSPEEKAKYPVPTLEIELDDK